MGTRPIALAFALVFSGDVIHGQTLPDRHLSLLSGIAASYPPERRNIAPRFPARESRCRHELLIDSVMIVADSPNHGRKLVMTSSWRKPRFQGDTIAWDLADYPSMLFRGADTVRASARGLICPIGNEEILLERDGYYFGIPIVSVITVYGWGDPIEVTDPAVYVIPKAGEISPLVLHRPDFGRSDAIRVTDERSWKAARLAARRAGAADRVARIRAKGWSAEITQTVIDRKVRIGMTGEMVRLAWGAPERVNTTTTASGSREQWVYGTGNYVYLTKGVVTTVQTSR